MLLGIYDYKENFIQNRLLPVLETNARYHKQQKKLFMFGRKCVKIWRL